MHRPYKSTVSISQPCGSPGCKPCQFSKPEVRFSNPVQVPRAGVPEVGLEPFTPRGSDLWSGTSFLLMDRCAGGEGFGKTVSPSHSDVAFYPRL